MATTQAWQTCGAGFSGGCRGGRGLGAAARSGFCHTRPPGVHPSSCQGPAGELESSCWSLHVHRNHSIHIGADLTHWASAGEGLASSKLPCCASPQCLCCVYAWPIQEKMSCCLTLKSLIITRPHHYAQPLFLLGR